MPDAIGRSLGIDFGSKRIGVATCDANGTLASPSTVIERSGDVGRDHKRINVLVAEEEAVRVVVGVPITMEGKHDIAAKNVLEEVELLKVAIDVPVELWDERLTTAGAHKAMQEQNLNEKQRRKKIDSWAAASILQGWLDRQTDT